MARKPNLLRRVVAEMTGKIEEDRWLASAWSGFARLFSGKDLTVDYAKNDYELFRSIYHASKVNKKGEEYLLAAALGKPIINITTGFVVGKGFKVELDNPDRNPQMTATEDKINDWLENNMADLYDSIKFHFRDGDAYIYVDELGEIDILDAMTVTIQLDPVSGKVIGFDVREVVDEKDPANGQKQTYVYLKQYREDSIRITRFRENDKQENGSVVFERTYREEAGNDFSPLVRRRLPVIHFVNEPEAKQVYGNSEYQNLLTLFKHYHAVLTGATKGVVYNGTPIPVLKGVSNPEALADSTKPKDIVDADEKKKLDWGQDTVIYLTGDHSDAKFLQVSGIMDDASKLLEIYFFLFVQGSETPEFAFGTAVTSSKASTETQMPVLVKKVERKQRRLTGTIQGLVKLYIEKQALLSDPDFLKIWNNEPKIRVNFPKVNEDDKKLTLETVQWAVENELMTGKTALELIAGDLVKDVTQEIKDAAQEAAAMAEKNAKLDTARMVNELALANAAAGNNPTDGDEPVNDNPEDE